MISEFIKTYIDKQKHQMIKEYEVLRSQGKLGDCLLRQAAQRYIRENGMSGGYVVRCMGDIALECYRYFYQATYK
jgi:coenzyme F420-reducing hydrogenase beta subunit